HVPEFEARNDLCGVTGKHPPRGSYIERAPAPTADAGLGKTRVIVGDHRIDNDLSTMPVAQGFDLAYGFFHLLARRHESGAVLERPAVILHVSDFDTGGAKRQRQLYHRLDAADIGTMHNRVDGERHPESDNLLRHRALAPRCALVAGDV